MIYYVFGKILKSKLISLLNFSRMRYKFLAFACWLAEPAFR